MGIKCPRCGRRGFHQLGRAEYPTVAPQIIGGIALALVFHLSRKSRFCCDRCGEVFYSHTIGTRIWFALWTLAWVSAALAILALLIRGGF